MFGRDPWGGPLEISNADSATDDDRSRDLDRGALMRQLDETQQSWLLAGPGDQAGKKKKKYVDLGCMVLDRKIFMWTVGTILGVGLFIGFVMMIVKLVPHKRPPPPPPDQYTQALHKALMFFNAQRCEFFSLLSSLRLHLCLHQKKRRKKISEFRSGFARQCRAKKTGTCSCLSPVSEWPLLPHSVSTFSMSLLLKDLVICTKLPPHIFSPRMFNQITVHVQ
jgi:hypothetical protein